jgi:acyl transferase domain-containing protein/enoyl-CoA hydratase/carnithine racemase/acyl carrier protein
MMQNLPELFQEMARNLVDGSQTACADGISRFLQQSEIDPAEFLLTAAGARLMPVQQPPAGLPDGNAVNQYLLQHMERRQYRIRVAQTDDLPALLALENLCWAQQLRTPETVLRQRIETYPQGQLVLLVGDAVAGVIYSQRISHADVLDGVSVAQVDALHDPQATVAQLLAVNVLPRMQQQNLGDQLLEFMLIRCSLQKELKSVVAVTLCRNYDRAAGVSVADYIRQRKVHGVLADPILRFHELHGAIIERPMPGYRPADRNNDGHGVLVRYDIHHRSRNGLQIERAAGGTEGGGRFSRAEIRRHLQQAVGDCLGEQYRSVFGFDRPLMEMGLDSADMLELNEKISHHFQLPLSLAFFFQYNTADKIAGYLASQIGQGESSVAAQELHEPDQPKPRAATRPTAREKQPLRAQDVAIVGMACRMPGCIDTPEELWQCLASGTSVIGDLPPGRWQWPIDIDPANQHQGIARGGYLEHVADFDAPFFRISPAEAESMDPQQRILLELCWQAIEHAGHAPDSLAGSATGVFIGASGSDYTRLLDRIDAPVDAHYGTGSSMAVLANRISYFCDLNGPSLVLDTACSSSLVAVHEAVQSIQSGESSQALVGGINLILHPANGIAYHKAGMLADDGFCKTFDRRANGYVRSEGAVVLLLRPLSAAVADGDSIYAVIRGSACNHGGQASGLTVPNPGQQARLLQAAWQSAEIDPFALGYIEAHGTGTSLGDPIEVQGIQQSFSQALAQDSVQDRAQFFGEQRCGLGSLKTNLGHLEAAAGIAGLLKAVLCLQHRQLPATVHFHQLNEHIKLGGSGLYIVDRLRAWLPPTDGGPRLAGVSSFGSGGANAHVVLAEHASAGEAADDAPARPPVFILSAKTRQQLLAYAQKYIDWLGAGSGNTSSMSDLCGLLQTGRQAMPERLALVVTDRDDLLVRLRAFCLAPDLRVHLSNGKTVAAQIRELTEGAAGKLFIRTLAEQGEWDKVALLWQSGFEVDWALLHDDEAAQSRPARRFAAPTYPFARHRYWLPTMPAELSPGVAAMATVQTSSAPVQDPVVPALLVPHWQPLVEGDGGSGDRSLSRDPDQKLLFIGATPQQQQTLRGVHPNVDSIAIDPAATIETLREQIRQFGKLDQIVWVAPKSDGQGSLIGQQDGGLLYLFRLVKALLAEGYGERELGMTVITVNTQAVFGGENLLPAHAGVHGLTGAMAKELSRWVVRSIDLENELENESGDALISALDASFEEAATLQGDVLARRSGQWFRRFLVPVATLPESTPAYRQDGVYVVIGGAGGIGEAWTRDVMQRCQARVIWIGRREKDAAIQARLDALDGLGPVPVYLSADASDLASLRAAHAAIRKNHPAIHGVIHSATGLFDLGLAAMDEQRFRDILSVKIDASVNLAQVFGEEALDFILYFSSIVALEKNGGLSGYAAGGAFEDALALSLAGEKAYAVKTINWGHWEIGAGASISNAARIRLLQSGCVPIQPEEAMSALQRMLNSPLNQIALLKTSRPDLLPFIDQGRSLGIWPETIPRCIDRLPQVPEKRPGEIESLKPLSLFNNAAMEAELRPLFAATLASLGLLDADAGFAQSPDTAMPAYCRKWLASGRKMLAGHGFGSRAAGGLDHCWQRWEENRRNGFGAADLIVATELVEACLRALPGILSGATRATEILFPDASMKRVEGIYRNNAVADYFNGILAESLVAAIEIRLQEDPCAQLRILEIGAGAGGSTALILPRLQPYRQHIVEYAYTDLSKAFLFHAEEQFVPHYPYLAPKLFDVEKPLAGQGISAQHYDFVIATNVLHATRNIRNTLANAKAALRKNGLLLLNEISSKSLFAHLSFGLLEGWWLSDDQVLRIPDAPGLYPEGWRRVLLQEGFAGVLFPAPDTHVLGQQIIVAESDGIVVQQDVEGMRSQQAEQKQTFNPASSVHSVLAGELPKQAVIGADEALKEVCSAQVKKIVARTLRMDGNAIDVSEPWKTYGIDSILLVQITKALRDVFSDIRSTLLFECRSIDALSNALLGSHRDQLRQLSGLKPDSLAAAVHAATPARAGSASDARREAVPRPGQADGQENPEHDAIAVIGMSCHFPQARNLDEYWQVLSSGKDCVTEVPSGRWSMKDFFEANPDQAVEQGKSYSKWGGFLDHVTDFDPLFFNISPKEAIAIDPQERLFLQAAWEALEDAGYTRERLAKDFGHQLGIFAGMTRTGFDLFGPELWRHGHTIYPHTSFSSAANRVSFFLDAHGPSVPVDTMCSSSLTAIHQACQSLRSGECRLALAGGVNIYLHPSGYVGLSASRMLSRDGVCRSFGQGANGFVPGEGAGAILLKPLASAIADGDRIHAVIRASHVNHGGRTNGYTVPNPLAHAELIRDAMQKAGVNARAVSYIEAHGTGTELGDPIEVSGLTQAFRHDTHDTGFCALGSAKANIGHLEAAAGIAGFIKVVLQMRHGKLAPSLHAADLNPHIEFEKTPFVVQQTLTDWKRPLLAFKGGMTEFPRIAGISSFGAGGANAHVVVEEYLPPQRAPLESGQDCMVLLSARNEERLKAAAARLLDFLGRRDLVGERLELADLAYTLQVGREPMDARLAIVASSLAQLQDRLRAYLGGQPEVANLHQGQAKHHKDLISAFAGDDAMHQTLQAWFGGGKHARLLNVWSKGLNIDWQRLWQHSGLPLPRRISLPTYPFAATAYWLPVIAEDQRIPARPAAHSAELPAPDRIAAPVAPQIPRIELPAIDHSVQALHVVPPKPAGIALRELASIPASFQAPTAGRQYALSPLPAGMPASEKSVASAVVESSSWLSSIELYDHGDGILAVRASGHTASAGSAAAALIECLQLVNKLAAAGPRNGVAPKVLLLRGLDRLFAAPLDGLPSDESTRRSVANAAAAIAASLIPVLAVLSGTNRACAMLMASASDWMICSSEASYDFNSPAIGEQEFRLLARRFGSAGAASLVAAGALDGEALRQAGLMSPIVAQARIDGCALEAAGSIARASASALMALKKHWSEAMNWSIENLAAPSVPVDAGFVVPARMSAQVNTAAHTASDMEAPQAVALDSDVVTLQKYRNGVVVVSLCDRASKNTFSPEFVSGVIAAFNHINATPAYKVVVLTGYDNYFACGGTRQGLLAIQNGSARFTDEQSYSMPLLCEIPVIAAMQGHAIGAGWAMGLYCDWAAYSEESVYQSPYMLYGFTPGAGSTLLFPLRLGHDFSREILMTAREFSGRELKQRGITMPVMPRNQVFGYAMALAGHLARSTRAQLVQQKNLRCQPIRERLQGVFAQELAMHDKTFVNNPEVIENISRHFNDAAAIGGSVQMAVHGANGSAATSTASAGNLSQQQVLEVLAQGLGDELQMQREQVDPDANFTDLGLDSVVAVTWVRKINARFGLSIGATKIYSYPSLTSFAGYVLSLAKEAQAASVGGAEPALGAVAKASVEAGAIASDQLEDAVMLAWLRETLARELLMQPDALDDDMKFIDMGLDSITAVTWIRAINGRFGLSIGATKVYSYPSLSEFHRYLAGMKNQQDAAIDAAPAERVAPRAREQSRATGEPVLLRRFELAIDAAATLPEPAASKPVSVPLAPLQHTVQASRQQASDVEGKRATATSAIAIIGMAGQFPKAEDIRQFWRNLEQGRECISEIPPTRWSLEEFYDPDRNAPGKTVCKYMGLLDDVDVFDPLFFNISPSEAEYMDPQQRLFLQNSWRCIEDAGYNPQDLSGSLCGVFVGCTGSDYSKLMADLPHCAQGLLGESLALLPARIAYFLNLQGPCLAIDTACSSSLVALASACDSLVLGSSDLALAGGVYVINGPDIHVKMSKAGMLSPDGRCFSFDQRANGFVPGEGVGVVLLKRLDEAQRDGDDIYGVIRGWGVNQDGKSNGITAPNAESQTRLETSVYRKFGINPEHIGLIEAHGTGTKLGDPIEVDALREAFGQFTRRRNFCALGSVKSNIGHLATAAGVTGVIKSALALQHRTLPPTINYQSLNEHIALKDSPFYVNTECRSWEATIGQKRLVAVSSFGFSGTNAHLVLEEAAPWAESIAARKDVPVLLPLSAKSSHQLTLYAQTLADFLREPDGSAIGLADLAYTFQVGRAALPHRLAVVANSVAQLRACLAGYAADGATSACCVAGEVRRKTPAGASEAGAGPIKDQSGPTHLQALSMRWVAGEAVDWASLYPAGRPLRRHGLPAYPFAREHYWTPEADINSDESGSAGQEPVIKHESEPAVADAGQVASTDRSKIEAVDSMLWQEYALPDAIDWQDRIRRKQDRQVLVIYTDERESQAFKELLTQLTQACGLAESAGPRYCSRHQISEDLTEKRTDTVLFLGGAATALPADLDALAQCLKAISGSAGGFPSELVIFMQADAMAAERLADLVRAKTSASGQNCLLLTQDDCDDPKLAIQRVCTEWFALGHSASLSALTRIHYASGKRLARRATDGDGRTAASAQSASDAVCLINKEWRAVDPQPMAQPLRHGEVLVLVNHESLPIARSLLEAEDFKKIILVADSSIQPNQIQNSINFSNARSARISAQILIEQCDEITHIIDLSDLYDTPKIHDADNPGKTVFYQTLIGACKDIAILYCTKGLQLFQSAQASLAGAKFAGLVKMLGAEYRHVSARSIDIDQATYDQPRQLRQILLQEFGSRLLETELCYRKGQRYAPMLSAVKIPEGQGTAPQIAQDGVYVISGGTNGVGLEIAKYLAANGCSKLVLMGVTPLPPRHKWAQAVNKGNLDPYLRNKLLELIELDGAVADLLIYTGSLSSHEALQHYFRKIRSRLGLIRGVVHSAAVYSDPDTPGFVGKDLERMRRVWEPKVGGLESMHALFKSDSLDFFVSFSSMTGMIPHLARGAADYAMANSFVDFFSAYQHHCSGHARAIFKTIIWSDWNQTGAITRIAAEKRDGIEENFRELGIRTFSNQEGCALFAQAINCTPDSRAFIGFIDRQKFEHVRPRMLHASLAADEADDQPPSDRPKASAKAFSEPSFLHHLDRWEAERLAGLDVSIHKITEVISLDQIKNLGPALIHRVHKLLFGAASQQAAQQAGQAAEQPPELPQVIARTVMEVLKLKDISPTQAFQNYGLDSISAMVLATRLEKRLKLQVQAQWLIEYSTVDSLSQHLAAQRTRQPQQ